MFPYTGGIGIFVETRGYDKSFFNDIFTVVSNTNVYLSVLRRTIGTASKQAPTNLNLTARSRRPVVYALVSGLLSWLGAFDGKQYTIKHSVNLVNNEVLVFK